MYIKLVVGQRAEEMEVQLKEKDSDLLKRDRVITELRVRLPASSDRDAVFDKVTSQSAKSPRDEDYESSQAVRVATSTVSSLQVTIACCHNVKLFYAFTSLCLFSCSLKFILFKIKGMLCYPK